VIPILSTEQIRAADQYTIQHEPIVSIDLMERASRAFVEELVKQVFIRGDIYVFCGSGNNGGDGLAISRLLMERELPVKTYAVGDLNQGSPDFVINYHRIEGQVEWLESLNGFPEIDSKDLVIDALFGSGLSRPIEGFLGDLIQRLNEITARKVSVDIASGLFADKVPEEDAVIFQPDLTISFQVPKWSFFQPALSRYVGEFRIVNIDLDSTFIAEQNTDCFLSEPRDFHRVFHKRERFSHKGDYGRLLIIAGSYGKMGAAVMAAQAAFRSGAGLVFLAAPACGVQIVQQQVKEAMVIEAGKDQVIDFLPDISPFDVVVVGPGLGEDKKTCEVMKQLLQQLQPHQKLVIDADGLNILSSQDGWYQKLPERTILTPHPGEFRRMVGEWKDDAEKLKLLRNFAIDHGCNIVLKGAFSAVADASGNIYFNPTGNPGMATAGSGDVLSGVITGLLCTGITAFEALRAGVFVHGVAGDLAAEKLGERSMMAGDLILNLPNAFKEMM
jgi:hydroxyethylthiazole kinase-like uncharacterized protein yjeF